MGELESKSVVLSIAVAMLCLGFAACEANRAQTGGGDATADVCEGSCATDTAEESGRDTRAEETGSGGEDTDEQSDVASDAAEDGSSDDTVTEDVAKEDAAGDTRVDGDTREVGTDGEACTDDCLHELPNCDLADVEREPGSGWADSYSVNGKCYCDSTFDHGIGEVMVDTPDGKKTVREVCEAIGPGPGAEGNPVYNDIQCGHGPPNNAGDEDWCPGRVDQGKSGCCTAGPRWDLQAVDW